MCLLGLAHSIYHVESESTSYNDILVDWFIYVVGDREGEIQHGMNYSEVCHCWNRFYSLCSIMVNNRTLSTTAE